MSDRNDEGTAINFSAALRPETPVTALPRARGSLRVASARSPDCSRLRDLFQSGSLKILFPSTAGRNDLLGVCINTAGGMTGGDRFDIAAEAATGSRLTLTTQAAERIYRSQDGEPGRLSSRITVGPGARLDWMPQETILFDRSCLRRKLDIRLADDASFLMVEPLVFGRATMGERLRHIDFRDDIRLTRGGSLIFADAIRLTGDASDLLGHAAVAKGAGAVVSLLYSAPDADLFLPLLRDLMPPGGGVSLIRPGVLFARLLAKDSYLLRQTLIPMMTLLHGGPLPKTWTL